MSDAGALGSIVSAIVTLRSVIAQLWERRMIGHIPQHTRDERAEYAHLLRENNDLAEDFGQFVKEHPEARYSDDLERGTVRPLTTMPATDTDRAGMALQDQFSAYVAHLGRVLRRYQWPSDTLDKFTLLRTRIENREYSRAAYTQGFERHGDLLRWLLNRGTWEDVLRKLTAIKALRDQPWVED
jgi:hypothetical protein